MPFGKLVGVACASFAITNIDDLFVLATFFSESSDSKTLTPVRIVLGQFIGFTVIVAISLIGYGIAFVLPTEPIGFLGFMPMMLGVWRLFTVIFKTIEEEDETSKLAGIKNVLKVSIVTLMNGGDNISTYIPLFSQARNGDIAIYIVIFYILLGIWCFAAFLIMTQKHILAIMRRYMRWGIPFLYMGLGLYIVIKSSCFPWSIEKINKSLPVPHPGRLIMAIVTTFLLLTVISSMLWYKLRKRALQATQVSDVVLESSVHPSTLTITNLSTQNASTQLASLQIESIDPPISTIVDSSTQLASPQIKSSVDPSTLAIIDSSTQNTLQQASPRHSSSLTSPTLHTIHIPSHETNKI